MSAPFNPANLPDMLDAINPRIRALEAERAALLATRQRYEAALRQIVAEWGRGTAKGQALSMHDIAREALAHE